VKKKKENQENEKSFDNRREGILQRIKISWRRKNGGWYFLAKLHTGSADRNQNPFIGGLCTEEKVKKRGVCQGSGVLVKNEEEPPPNKKTIERRV